MKPQLESMFFLRASCFILVVTDRAGTQLAQLSIILQYCGEIPVHVYELERLARSCERGQNIKIKLEI